VPVSIDPAKAAKLFAGWKQAGATLLMTRPRRYGGSSKIFANY
jgi:hypothetical protein